MKLFSKSFSARLTAYILAVTALLFVIAIYIMAIFSRKLIEEEASRGAENILKSTVRNIEKTLTSVESSARSTVWMVQAHKNDPEYMYEITKSLIESNPLIVGSTVAFIPNYYPSKGEYFAPYSYKDESTKEITSFQMGNEDYDYHTMEWFQLPYLLNQAGWCEPYYDEGGGEQMMTTYSIPITDENDKVYAVITADISLKQLTQQVSATKPYANSFTVLISNNGSYITHPLSEKILNETILSSSYEKGDSTQISIAMDMVNKKSGNRVFRDHDGGQSLVIFRPISNGWSAAIVCPIKDVLKKTMEMNVILIIVLAAGLILLALFCWLTIRRLTRPLSQFSASALSIAEGNFQTALPRIKSHDEMRRLHDSFAYMKRSLTTYIEELKTTTSAKERIESELNIARGIQLNMVPTRFTDNLYAVLHPAKEVGGDLYDFYDSGDELQFAIGDVSGKGVPAALFMAITRSSFLFVGGLGLSVEDVVKKINDAICTGNKEMLFVTLFAARYHKKTQVLEYCNGGHNPIVVIEPSEDGGEPNAYYLHAKANLAVGLMPDFPYQGEEIKLKQGTRIILYTDGVTEAENKAQEQYGEDRLLDFARKSMAIKEPEACTKALLQDVKDFTNGNEQNDDITILTINL